jgi:hypothetical protein
VKLLVLQFQCSKPGPQDLRDDHRIAAIEHREEPARREPNLQVGDTSGTAGKAGKTNRSGEELTPGVKAWTHF